MCGRVTITAPASDIQALFDVQQSLFEPVPRYNASPGQQLPVITARDGVRTLEPMKWGLHYQGYKTPAQKKEAAEKKAAGTGKPVEKKKAAPPPINARAEGVLENFAFRFSMEKRRCILPADGWYEWPEFEGEKWAYRCHFCDNRLFGMPAIWDHWKQEDGTDLLSFAVITGEPGVVSAAIHDRRPMFLPTDCIASWLDPAVTGRDALALLVGEPEGLEAYPVSRAVGSYKSEGPELIEPIEGTVFK